MIRVENKGDIRMNRLKSLREERGMKQSELGQLLNVKEAAISKYESEKVLMTSDTLIELSKIFQVSIDYILGNEVVPPKKAVSTTNINPLNQLDKEIIQRFHNADSFDQIAILRILNIKEKETIIQSAK